MSELCEWYTKKKIDQEIKEKMKAIYLNENAKP